MGWAVGTDQPRPVHGEAHRKRLDRHIVHHLVIGSLQEGRVDGAEGPEALAGKPGGKGHRVLLGNADVEGAAGKFLGEEIEARAGRHRRRDRHHLLVLLRLTDKSLGEHLGVAGRRPGSALFLLPREHIELRDAVIFVRRLLRRLVALALLGHHMHENGAVLHVVHVLQHRDQMIEIVTVDRADIVKAEFLEERAAHPEAARIFLGALGRDSQ